MKMLIMLLVSVVLIMNLNMLSVSVVVVMLMYQEYAVRNVDYLENRIYFCVTNDVGVESIMKIQMMSTELM